MVKQGVDQSAVGVPGGWMDHQPFRLIEDNHIVVLVADIQRNVLRHNVHGFRLRQIHGENLPRHGLLVFLHCAAVTGDAALFQKPLGGGPGYILQQLGQRHVHAHAAFRTGDSHSLSPFFRSNTRTHSTSSAAPMHTKQSATLKMAKFINSTSIMSTT